MKGNFFPFSRQCNKLWERLFWTRELYVSSFCSCFSSHKSWSHFKLTTYLPFPETEQLFLVQDLHLKRKTTWETLVCHPKLYPLWQWSADEIVTRAKDTFSGVHLAKTRVSTSANFAAFPPTSPGHGWADVLGITGWAEASSLTWLPGLAELDDVCAIATPLFCWAVLT